MSTQRLELTWIGKNHPDYDIANIEPRILIEDPEKSYGDSASENMLIHWDNLLALKALLPEYEGKIKCIYIDPPYNTGNAFEHYDDSVEHSTWLSLMRPRLELLMTLLSKDGVIFISIDDDECHYLKVLCDEVFWRKNYTGSFIWEKKKKPSFLSNMGSVTENILSYAKNKIYAPAFTFWETTEGKKYPFNNAWNWIKILEFPVGSVMFKMKDWVIDPVDMSEWNIVTKLLDTLIIENWTNKNIFRLEWEWRYSQKKLEEIVSNKEEIIISRIPFRPNHVKLWGDPKKAKNLLSIAHYGISTYEDSTEESIALFWKNAFDYPKPEKLLNFFIETVTKPGDLILDSFLGSGTTAAVAHKMWRKWIGIEMGNHAYTHCKVRLDKVIDNEDQWWITKSMDWEWGGGYKFYELAPSFITIDEFGNRVIDEFYDDAKLVRAMCKLLGYTFRPSSEDYFRHGVGTGQNYIYITTQMMNSALVRQIAGHLWVNESLVIATKKYEPGTESVDPRITIKKIPQSVLKACQYGKKEYLLPIKESAIEEIEDEDDEEIAS